MEQQNVVSDYVSPTREVQPESGIGIMFIYRVQNLAQHICLKNKKIMFWFKLEMNHALILKT